MVMCFLHPLQKAFLVFGTFTCVVVVVVVGFGFGLRGTGCAHDADGCVPLRQAARQRR
jgi:hypothetical protein